MKPVSVLVLMIPLVIVVGFKACKDKQEENSEEFQQERRALMEQVDTGLHIDPSGMCVSGDPILWLEKIKKQTVLGRGRDSGWQWACLATAHKGVVVFAAVDSGCPHARGGGLITHSCRYSLQVLDIKSNQFGNGRSGSTSRSSWVMPPASQLCSPRQPPDPPDDSARMRVCRNLSMGI